MVGVGDQLVERKRLLAGKDAYVGHANERNSVPAFGAHGSVGVLLADRVCGFARREIAGELSVGDDRSALCGDALVVISKRSQSGAVLLGGVGDYVHDWAGVAKVAELVDGEERCAG